MRRHRDGRRFSGFSLLLLFIIVAASWDWFSSRPPSTDSEPESRDDVSPIVRALTPQSPAAAREGIAAMVLIDVSGSMDDRVRDGGQRRSKIQIAREAAAALIRQFDAYGRAHPDETVLVGLMEFSERDDEPSAREVIALSPADPERADLALARMRAKGGTPIGDAMIEGQRALDRTGLSRRHLLVVTDGENTDGAKPVEVMNALAQRPEAERPSVYFVAFDIEASRFERMRDAGSLVLPAANAQELNSTLDTLLSGKILVESP